MTADKRLKIAFFGLPGAGKGTQAQKVGCQFGLPHISTGDIFRRLQSEEGELAGKIRETLSSGKLISDELVTEMVEKRLSKPDCQQGFILDGYPRTIPQAQSLQDSVNTLNLLIDIRLPQDVIIDRLCGRRVCSGCSGLFHIDFLSEDKSMCPKCRSALVHREDDREEAIATRLKVFKDNVAPIRQFFEKQGILAVIDGNHDPQKVYQTIESLLIEKGFRPK